MPRTAVIDFIERNIRGAWVIYGSLGIRQYYYYTKKEAERLYRKEYKQSIAPFICHRTITNPKPKGV